MDHDLPTAPDSGAATAGPPETGALFPPTAPPAARPGSAAAVPAARRSGPPRRPSAGDGAGNADPVSTSDPVSDVEAPDAKAPDAGRPDPELVTDLAFGNAPSPGVVRLSSPGSVVASIPLLFGFHPDNSLVILGIGGSIDGGRHIRHGVRINLDQIRGRERTAALELAARLRDHEAEIAILIAFGPRGATGAKARPDHCRKLMAAFRAQIEATPTEERVTVVDALYTANGRWWSYMCRNTRCCPTAGTVVPTEAPPGLTAALATRGHTVYPTREALDATLAPYPPETLARTAAATEHLDPAYYDTDAGLATARHLMDALLLRCGPTTPPSASTAPRTRRSATTTAELACAARRLTITAKITPSAPSQPMRRDVAAATPPPRTGTAPAERSDAVPRSTVAIQPNRYDAASPPPRTLTDAERPRHTAADAESPCRTAADAPAPSRRDTAPGARPQVAAAEPSRSTRPDTAVSALSQVAAAERSGSTRDDTAPGPRPRAAAAEPSASTRRDIVLGAPSQVAAAERSASTRRDTATGPRPQVAVAEPSGSARRLTALGARPRVAAAEPSRSTRRITVTAAIEPTADRPTTRRRRRALAADAPRTPAATASVDAPPIPAARSARRTNRVPALGGASDAASAPDADAPLITDAEVAQLLVALLNWRVRDYLACAAATEDSAGRLLRLCTELARRAPYPELRLAPYALAAWAAWAIGRPAVAQCAVDRALAIDPEYKFASLIRAGLHHAIDGEGVRESAANTRRDLFGESPVDSDTDPECAPVPVPPQRSTEPVPTDTDLEVP